MIVKVKMPTQENLENPCVVIHDEKKELLMHAPASGPIKARMGKALTRYFHATIEHGSLQLGDVARDQAW